MGKAVSHLAVQIISHTLMIKRNLTFDTANWSFIFLCLDKGKSEDETTKSLTEFGWLMQGMRKLLIDYLKSQK